MVFIFWRFFGVKIPINAKGDAIIRDHSKKSELTVLFYGERNLTESNYLILDTGNLNQFNDCTI
jgi:hypothetical protein